MTSGRLTGKVAFVTGAAQGQGRAHVVRLAQEGAEIVALDLQDPNESNGDASAFSHTIALVRGSGKEPMARQCDVRDGEKLAQIAKEAREHFGRLDIVVANAGIIPAPRLMADLPFDAFQRTIEVNLYGVWHTCRAAVPHIIAGKRGGSVLIISSIFGLKASVATGHYTSSKHAVVGLMKNLALELAPHSIRVNSIHPTTVDTPMLESLTPPGLSREENAARLMAINALPIPWVDPVDISNAIVFLASEEGRYITGIPLPVDAGALLK